MATRSPRPSGRRRGRRGRRRRGGRAVERDVEAAAAEPTGDGQLPLEDGVEVGVPGDQLAGLADPEGLDVGVGLLVERTVARQRRRDEVGRRREDPVLGEVVLDRRLTHSCPPLASMWQLPRVRTLWRRAITVPLVWTGVVLAPALSPWRRWDTLPLGAVTRIGGSMAEDVTPPTAFEADVVHFVAARWAIRRCCARLRQQVRRSAVVGVPTNRDHDRSARRRTRDIPSCVRLAPTQRMMWPSGRPTEELSQ